MLLSTLHKPFITLLPSLFMHPTSPIGVPEGQFNDIIFAYETGIERTIVLKSMDIHLFTKPNDVRCITVHTLYFSYALFDYNLQVVCKKKKQRMIRITPKDVHNNQALCIYLDTRTV